MDIIVSMNKIGSIKKALILFPIILVLAGCATGPSESDNLIHGIDLLVAEIAFETVQLISVESDMTLAVYYFTVDGKESSISDYLITGLTTEIANLAGDGITMVSRQGLDRVMSEYSFMVSDLVSEDTQVDIGELLGADVILIGFISPLTDYDKINIQLIDVETGAVLGGFFLDYILESGFSRDTSSEIITITETAVQIAGASTVTTVYENFDGPVIQVSSGHHEEYWGDRIIYASGKTGSDDNGFGYLDFEAEFDSLDMLEEWQDSDLIFYLNYETGQSPAGNDGLSVSIYPEGFSDIILFVMQQENDIQRTFASSITVNPDEWTQLKVPFHALKDESETGPLAGDVPVSIGFAVPFIENYSSFHFREDLYLKSRLRVDDLGLFRFKEDDPPEVIAAFEDEVSRAPGEYMIGGSHLYTDYSLSDIGVLKKNPGVDYQELLLTIEEDGPAGRFLRLTGKLGINHKILDYIEDEQSMVVSYRMSMGKSWSSFNTLTWLIKSDVIESGYLDIIGNGTDQYYSSDFSIHSGWSQIKKPYSTLISDDSNMAADPLRTEDIWLIFIFEISETELKKAAGKGILEFNIDLDQIILQER